MTQIQNIAVSGQWNLIVTPTDASYSANYYANIADQGSGSFYAPSGNVLVARGNNADSGVFEQRHTSLLGKLAGNKVTIALNARGNNRLFIGVLSDDGKTMSGTYTDGLGGGTWAAQKRPAVTGTYTGMFASVANPSAKPILLAADISQDDAFGITGTAVVENARFTSLAFGPGSRAVGGAFHLVDSSSGATFNLIPFENGKLSLTAPFYASYQCVGDVGTGTVNAQ